MFQFEKLKNDLIMDGVHMNQKFAVELFIKH